jgi:hypothetical protein
MVQRTGPRGSSDSSPPPTLEEAVRVLWDEKPGTGVTELMAGVCRLLPHEAAQEGAGKAVLKKRVKAAKSALPYARAADQPGAEPDFQKEEMVRKLLEQRQGYRDVKQWARADAIIRGLKGMGVAVDDALKSWSLGPVEQEQQVDPPPAGDLLAGSVPCKMCGRCVYVCVCTPLR